MTVFAEVADSIFLYQTVSAPSLKETDFLAFSSVFYSVQVLPATTVEVAAMEEVPLKVSIWAT